MDEHMTPPYKILAPIAPALNKGQITFRDVSCAFLIKFPQATVAKGNRFLEVRKVHDMTAG